MVSVLELKSDGSGRSLGSEHSVLFSDKTLYSYSTSLHPGVKMGTKDSRCIPLDKDAL